MRVSVWLLLARRQMDVQVSFETTGRSSIACSTLAVQAALFHDNKNCMTKICLSWLQRSTAGVWAPCSRWAMTTTRPS